MELSFMAQLKWLPAADGRRQRLNRFKLHHAKDPAIAIGQHFGNSDGEAARNQRLSQMHSPGFSRPVNALHP